MRYGIQTLSPKYFGGAPELAVAGFNVGVEMTTNIPRPKSKPGPHNPHIRHRRRRHRSLKTRHPRPRL
ncbi:MAG: hypothetical protein Q9204_009169 [Flavoplaca sp. TL-2023a]